MAVKRTKSICMYAPESEQQMMKKIAGSQHLTLSELVRKCAFTDYEGKSAKIRGDDCLDFLNTTEAVVSAIRSFHISLKKASYPDDHLVPVAESISEQVKIIYQNVDKIRSRIRKYATKKMLDSQVAFAEIEGMKGKRVSNRIMVSEEEFSALKKMSAETGKSQSEILRMSVIGKCLTKEIVIDSYPLDQTTADIQKSLRAMQAIVQNTKENGITAEDVANMYYFADAVNATLQNLSIPMEQKDTRREANRIVEGGRR